MIGVVATAAAVLAASYRLGRLRPWQWAGDWATDQVRFTGPWTRGGFGWPKEKVVFSSQHKSVAEGVAKRYPGSIIRKHAPRRSS
ncbi:hypothetical protein [Streptomyces sp. NPDC058295]|uniref:hypothetical protein n=1 Tax=Streptomyces sp. NPDC058295 TaxID=3346431 RepID=UPI0036F087B9